MSNPIVPIMNSGRGFSMWLASQVYQGPGGQPTQVFVPNLNDLILDYTTGFSQVTSVDYTTGLSTSIPWVPPSQQLGVLPQDTLLGAGPGTQSESYRCYINTNVSPIPMALDARLHLYGSDATSVKVFKGTNISSAGTVVSAILDIHGAVISQNLPLVQVQTPSGPAPAIYTPDVGYCVEALADGEVVTVVVYAGNGTVMSICTMLVKQTNFIRTTNASQKYVSTISLLSPYISSSNNTLLQIPVNLLLQSTLLLGRVNYSDGSYLILPIDGTRFQLHGLENFSANVVGMEADLVLVYNFANNEFGYSVSGPYPNRYMAENYQVTTTEVVGAYSVKLYVVPVWQSGTSGYTLNYYLYNLDRTTVYDVTPYVTLVGGPTFNPTAYNAVQNLTAQLNLNLVTPSFAYFLFSQPFTICLLAPGNTDAANWYVQYSSGGVQYGGSNAAVFTNTGGGNWSIDLSIGKVVTADWLSALYVAAQPLIDPNVEFIPPTPTHVRVSFGASFVAVIPVAQFATPLTASLTSPDPAQGTPVLLEFLQITGSTTLQLGMGYMPIWIG